MQKHPQIDCSRGPVRRPRQCCLCPCRARRGARPSEARRSGSKEPHRLGSAPRLPPRPHWARRARRRPPAAREGARAQRPPRALEPWEGRRAHPTLEAGRERQRGGRAVIPRDFITEWRAHAPWVADRPRWWSSSRGRPSSTPSRSEAGRRLQAPLPPGRPVLGGHRPRADHGGWHWPCCLARTHRAPARCAVARTVTFTEVGADVARVAPEPSRTVVR